MKALFDEATCGHSDRDDFMLQKFIWLHQHGLQEQQPQPVQNKSIVSRTASYDCREVPQQKTYGMTRAPNSYLHDHNAMLQLQLSSVQLLQFLSSLQLHNS